MKKLAGSSALYAPLSNKRKQMHHSLWQIDNKRWLRTTKRPRTCPASVASILIRTYPISGPQNKQLFHLSARCSVLPVRLSPPFSGVHRPHPAKYLSYRKGSLLGSGQCRKNAGRPPRNGVVKKWGRYFISLWRSGGDREADRRHLVIAGGTYKLGGRFSRGMAVFVVWGCFW